MKEGWTYKKVGELFTTYSGGTPHKSHNVYYDGGNIPWIRSGEVCQKYITECEKFITNEGLKNSSAKFFPINTVLVAMYGATAAQVGILKFEATSNQAVCGILPSDDYVPEFIYYWFKLIESDLASQAQGGAQPNISQQKIKNVLLPFLPLNEQQWIVDIIDKAFEHIDLLKDNAQKQLDEARKLFQAALTEAMQPKDGWEEKKLPDISENLDSIRVPVTKKNRNIGKYPYYGASGIVDYVNEYLFDEDLLCISEDGANLLMRTYPIAFPISGKVWVNNHAHVLRFKNMATQKYIQYFFEGLKLDEYITGAAQPKLTQKALNSIPIYLPINDSQIAEIVNRLDALSDNVQKLEEINRKVIAECDALKQSILRQIFE